jgi:hypothetical protein
MMKPTTPRLHSIPINEPQPGLLVLVLQHSEVHQAHIKFGGCGQEVGLG